MKNKHKNATPPRWIDKVLESFCAPHLLEEVLGDLHERFYIRSERMGKSKAGRYYLLEVFSFARPYIINRDL